MTNLRIALPLALLATTVPVVAAAGETPDPAASSAASPVGVDVEVDPIAYALDGYSLHVGLTRGHFRVDLGAYAIAMPEAVHGNEGFSASFDGFGAKAQYFPLARGTRLFVGAGVGVSRVQIEHEGTQMASRDEGISAGVHVGWRFDLPAGFYATPWVGVDYALTGGDDVILDGATFERSRWSVFPTVHLGYRFR